MTLGDGIALASVAITIGTLGLAAAIQWGKRGAEATSVAEQVKALRQEAREDQATRDSQHAEAQLSRRRIERAIVEMHHRTHGRFVTIESHVGMDPRSTPPDPLPVADATGRH